MTLFRVCSLSFEPLVEFTNNFPEMLAMITRFAVPRSVQGQGKELTLFPMLHMGYSSPSVIALDYDFTFLYKKVDSIQWHTGGDMIAFVSESTRLATCLVICLDLDFGGDLGADEEEEEEYDDRVIPVDKWLKDSVCDHSQFN